MSEPYNPGDFRVGEVVEWRNQVGPDARRNGTACIILGPLDFYEGVNSATGEVDFGFGYDVKDVEGAWFAFPWELGKRPPPGPDWITLCKLDQVGANREGSLIKINLVAIGQVRRTAALPRHSSSRV